MIANYIINFAIMSYPDDDFSMKCIISRIHLESTFIGTDFFTVSQVMSELCRLVSHCTAQHSQFWIQKKQEGGSSNTFCFAKILQYLLNILVE